MGTVAGASAVNNNDSTDVRWAPGYRHPTVHPTSANNAYSTFYPGIYKSTDGTTLATTYYSPSDPDMQPAGFVAASIPMPSITANVNPSSQAGSAVLAFGSTMADVVNDGTNSAIRQQSDLQNNRVLPNVPCFAPSVPFGGGKWEYSGNLYVDSNQVAGASIRYGFALLVSGSPSVPNNSSFGIVASTSDTATFSAPSIGSTTLQTGTTTQALVAGTTYPFSIAKTGFNASANGQYKVTFGSSLSVTFTHSYFFNGLLSMIFMCGDNAAVKPFRILNARFRQMP